MSTFGKLFRFLAPLGDSIRSTGGYRSGYESERPVRSYHAHSSLALMRYFRMSRHCLGLVLGLATLLLVPAVQAQEQASPERTVRVSGEATVTAEPDRATVRFGIVTRAETAEPARAKNAEAAKNAMNTVRDLGIPEANMRMESLRLQPRREYNPETKTQEEKGFEASRQIVVQLADLEQLPRLVTRVVQRGANRLEGIDYSLSDRKAVRNEALRTAAENARDKARLLATSLDAQLGSVQQINEQEFGFHGPSPRMEMQLAKSEQADAAPEPDAYAAGEIEVSAHVQVVFQLQ